MALYFDTIIDSEQIFAPGVDGPAELVQGLRSVLAEWVPSRKDRDRTRQILMAQRRLRPNDNPTRRRPMALVSQEYFQEALVLHKLFCHTGEADPSTLEKWESLATAAQRTSPDAGPRRRGRRTRRRRRPRRHGREGGPKS